MKKVLVVLISVAALSVGVAACGSGDSGTSAGKPTPTLQTQGSNVTVVMAEPGCHWFSTPNGNALKQTVSGPATISNYDEAALNVESNGKSVLDGPIPVGGKASVGPGTYTITMVNQEATDNTLTLTVQ